MHIKSMQLERQIVPILYTVLFLVLHELLLFYSFTILGSAVIFYIFTENGYHYWLLTGIGPGTCGCET